MRSTESQDPASAYALLLDALPVAGFLARPDGTVSHASRAFEGLVDAAVHPVVGRPFPTIVVAERRAAAAALWNAARARNTPYRDELLVRSANGAARWVLGQASPVFHPVTQELSAWFGVLVPIDEQRRESETLRHAVRALEESEARYRAFSETQPGITWTASPHGEFEFVADRRGATALPAFWLDGVHPHDRAAADAQWRAANASGEPFECQLRIATADGVYRRQLVRAQPMRDAAGAIARWAGVHIDIDEQARSHDAHAMFLALADNSNDFIGITDRSGQEVYLNRAARELLEIGATHDAQATQFIDYFSPAQRAAVRADVLPVLAGGGRWTGDSAFRNFRSGQPVAVTCNAFALVDRNGTVTGIATIARDRRERDRLDARLRLLARAGAAAVDSLDYLQTLRNVAQAFVPEFASFCNVDVITAEQGWKRTAVHRDPSREPALRNLTAPAGTHPVIVALTSGRSTRIIVDAEAIAANVGAGADRVAAVAALDVRSFITVPMVMPDGSIAGGLSCVRDGTHPLGDFAPDDVTFVEEAGRRAGTALANVRLYERERRIAVELQAASLPARLPRVAGLQLDAEYRPGSGEATIGGDWYDAFVLRDGRVAITIGDVLGHGLQAAITMTKLRQAMQSAAMVDPDPNVMLAVADQTLRLLDADGYATALAAIYDGRRNLLTFASAGHPGPVVRGADGRVQQFSSPGIMLGLRDAATRVAEITLDPGSSIVFFTDGLTEATHDMAAGSERFHEAVARLDVIGSDTPARAIVEYVIGAQQAPDDIAVLVARTGGSGLRP